MDASRPLGTRARAALLATALLALGACSTTAATSSPISTSPISTSPISTSEPSPSASATTTTTTTTPSTTSTTTTPSTTSTTTTPSTTTTTTTPSTTTTEQSGDDGGPAAYANLATAAYLLALDNVAVSVTVHRDGTAPWGLAAGRRADGGPVTTDSPFVVASVSKLVTALSIARLVERGVLTTGTRVPWDEMGLAHDPAWDSVTVRELLDHTSGMPVNRRSWLDDPGDCSVPLAEAIAAPPTQTRATWRYSNGNYCALGLLVEHLTGLALDDAANELVFDRAGVSGPYLSTDGLRDDSAPSPRGLARLSRLGGAGSWLASTDDVAAMLADVSDADLEVLRWPGVLVDQYGWGHTGTLDGAKACAWVMDDGRTVVVAVVAGSRPATGGEVCDAVVPALALDLGRWDGEPVRSPI